MVILILMISFIVLLIFGVPISFSIGLASIFSISYIGLPITIIAQRMINGTDSFSLLAVPFFVLAGSLMNTGGIAKRLLSFASCLVGFVKGGLAMVNIVGSMFFGGISGSAVADTVAIGTPIIPAMEEEGYDIAFAAAVTASSSTIGIIIPPSIPMIVYGVTAGQSIGRLFIAGIIPGILIGLAQMATTYYLALKNPEHFPRGKFPTLKEAFVSFKEAIFALLMPVFILGGIVARIVTPTEAAVTAIIYSLIIGGVVYKELKFKHLRSILIETVVGTAGVMFLVGTASLFGWIIAYEQIPLVISQWIQTVSTNPLIIILLINVILLITGTFLDLTAAIIILTPVLLPIGMAAGLNPIHFGIMMIINLAIGLVTPPVGICLFMCCNIAKISLARITKAIIPLIISMIVILLLVTFIPSLTLFLPEILIKRGL